MTYIFLPLDFRMVKDCGKIDKDRDVVCKDWHILSKIKAVLSFFKEAVTPDIFQIKISLSYKLGALLTPIMDNNERIQTSSTYISALEAFWLNNQQKTTSKEQLHHHMVSSCPVVTLHNQNKLQVGVK